MLLVVIVFGWFLSDGCLWGKWNLSTRAKLITYRTGKMPVLRANRKKIYVNISAYLLMRIKKPGFSNNTFAKIKKYHL
jgi:hypothetical protein